MTTPKDHTFVEALMLMWYACSCGHRELIWNSRDGVTPFGAVCPSCGNASLQHGGFAADVYAPDHQLRHGQNFWRDGTPDEAEAIMRRRIEKMRNDFPLMPDEESNLIQTVRSGEDNDFAQGWPFLVRHTL